VNYSLVRGFQLETQKSFHQPKMIDLFLCLVSGINAYKKNQLFLQGLCFTK